MSLFCEGLCGEIALGLLGGNLDAQENVNEWLS